MKKLVLVLMLLVSSSAIFAQGGLRVSLNQDLRHAVAGDDKGNTAFNPAFLFRFEMQGNQDKFGYLVVNVEAEYADLQVPQGFGYDDIEARKFDFGRNDYKRYSLGVGYTLNRGFINKIEANLSVNYGMIDRFGFSWVGFSYSGVLNYPITDRLSFQVLGQLTNRRDKLSFYGNDAKFTIDSLNLDFSGFIGVAYQIPINSGRGGGSRHYTLKTINLFGRFVFYSYICIINN